MVTIRVTLLLVLINTTCAMHAQQKSSPSFERALQKLKQENPALFGPSKKIAPQTQTNEQKNNTSMYLMMDRIGGMYALCKIAHAYRQIYSASESQAGSQDSNVIYQSIAWLARKTVPQPLQRLKQHTHFCALFVSICIESIAYKTIAKAALYCWHADLFDIAEHTIKRSKQLATALLP